MSHAKYCYENYPTVVNNIAKKSNSYNDTMHDFAFVDNNLAKSQLAIGESSNLAQLCLTYSYCIDNEDIKSFVDILAVIAQAAIDSAKREYCISIPDEIKRIKEAMNIEENLYPQFWCGIKKEFNPIKKLKDGQKISKINHNLTSPMNVLFDYKPRKFQSNEPTIPNEDFIIECNYVESKRKSKRVEQLIQDYQILIRERNLGEYEDDYDYMTSFMIFDQKLNDLINDIQDIHISNNYLYLLAYLARYIMNSNNNSDFNLNMNKSLLLKILYKTSPNQLLQVFSKRKNMQFVQND